MQMPVPVKSGTQGVSEIRMIPRAQQESGQVRPQKTSRQLNALRTSAPKVSRVAPVKSPEQSKHGMKLRARPS